MPTYLVAVDFSKCSRQMLAHAIQHARQDNARVVLVHAFRRGLRTAMVFDERAMDPVTELEQEMKLEDAVELTSEWAEVVRQEGVDVEVVAQEEDSVKLILDAADQQKADLIFMGREGHGGVAKHFLGSTADAVVRRARVPVLVVPCERD